MEKKEQLIKVSVELQNEIAKTFEVSTRTVRSAISFESNSLSANLIRAYAINHGGKLFVRVMK